MQNFLKPPDFSDAGNAAVFVQEFKADVLYTDSMGWLCWDGKRWERNEHKALKFAEDLTARMLEDARTEHKVALLKEAEAKAAGMDGPTEESKRAAEAVKYAKSYLSHAMITRRSVRIKAILELSMPHLVEKGESMDANPHELNTQGGIVNLHTGDIRPHKREAHCTKIAAVKAGTDGADIWQDFLDTVTRGDDSLKGFLQMVIGMTLFGKVYQEGVVFAVGGGSNGKSTFFNAVGAVLGDYTGYIDIDAITTFGNNKGATLATLRGKRLVIAGELEEGRRLSAATVKKISSTDPFQVEEKYRQPETVNPSHTLCLFTNHLPRVGSTDNGTWRRIIVIPFDATIQKTGTIKNYADYLVKKAGPAILSWAIEGAHNFAANGFCLNVPDCVEEATDAYRARENWLENFISDRCIKEPNARTGARELYAEYRDWSEALKDYTRPEKDFAAEMEKIGYSSVFPQRKKHYIGLRIDYSQKYGNRCNDYEIL